MYFITLENYLHILFLALLLFLGLHFPRYYFSPGICRHAFFLFVSNSERI